MANEMDNQAFDHMKSAAGSDSLDAFAEKDPRAGYEERARSLRGGEIRDNTLLPGYVAGNPEESTVLMATERHPKTGEWVSFPTLFYDPEKFGGWKEFSEEDRWGAFEEAESRGEVFYFGEDKKEALDFGEGSWKLEGEE